MSRFDYVKYDQFAIDRQDEFKQMMHQLENGITAIGSLIPEPARSASVGRAKALALTKLEEVYMWIGKAIRDDQIIRNGQASLQEERTKS